MLASARMNSRPARACASPCRALTMAEYFREQGRDCALLDTSFPLSSVRLRGLGAVWGAWPSTVGSQPTLETEMGQLQERSRPRRGSVTSIQPSRPGHTSTDPAARPRFFATSTPRRAFALDLGEALPAGRPLRLDVDDPQAYPSARSTPSRAPRSGYPTYRSSGASSPSASTSSLRGQVPSSVPARKIERFLTRPSTGRSSFTVTPASTFRSTRLLRSFREVPTAARLARDRVLMRTSTSRPRRLGGWAAGGAQADAQDDAEPEQQRRCHRRATRATAAANGGDGATSLWPAAVKVEVLTHEGEASTTIEIGLDPHGRSARSAVPGPHEPLLASSSLPSASVPLESASTLRAVRGSIQVGPEGVLGLVEEGMSQTSSTAPTA